MSEKNTFQEMEIKDRERLYSLAEVAKLAGVSYKTAWVYAKAKDPRLETYRRYPEQFGKRWDGKPYNTCRWAAGAIPVVRKMKKENIKGRGRDGRRWLDSKKLNADEKTIDFLKATSGSHEDREKYQEKYGEFQEEYDDEEDT